MRMRWLLILAAAAAGAPCTRNATRFTLYGERHSGTNLLQHLVEQNFRVDVRFQWGWKHFWLANASEPRAPEPDADVAVAVSLREVSAWLASMHRKPHHSPRRRGHGNTREWACLPFGSNPVGGILVFSSEHHEPPLQLLEQLVSTHALLLRTHLDVLAQQPLRGRG